MHSRFGAITLLNASRDARSPGDGLTEESYREKMFEQSEEREEMREALMSEGAETRLGVYAEVQGEEAAAQQRKPREKKKKKKKKRRRPKRWMRRKRRPGRRPGRRRARVTRTKTLRSLRGRRRRSVSHA